MNGIPLTPPKNMIPKNNPRPWIAYGSENLWTKLKTYMATSESFTDPNLTVVDVAEGIKVHPRLISTTINSQSKQNFNSYVNQLRIKKAEKLLKERKEANWSMEGIGIGSPVSRARAPFMLLSRSRLAPPLPDIRSCRNKSCRS